MSDVAKQLLVDCACPRFDAYDCLEFRSDRGGPGRWDEDHRPDDREPCECSCHEPDEMDDSDDGESHE